MVRALCLLSCCCWAWYPWLLQILELEMSVYPWAVTIAILAPENLRIVLRIRGAGRNAVQITDDNMTMRLLVMPSLRSRYKPLYLPCVQLQVVVKALTANYLPGAPRNTF
ncbi:hypothetical protein FKP32DRAFT_1587295 [Trametes sanguinea]|nr:hypothetical protein FKP32DRAFT_1587295 [Trametes sanguinea]